jgi:probable rRNA maturation factor
MTKTEAGICLQGQSGANCPDLDRFQAWVEAALGDRRGPFNLGIRIVDEDEMRAYNARYRNKDSVTNVLSFPADLPEGLPDEIRRAELGDLLICGPVVAREAVQLRRQETDHWAHLTIHGVLHLLGYDHEEDEEAQVMEHLETRILDGLGIADPYLDPGE